eukprot:CAMPEP_0197908822 /NCGR_PEP_ID=MMETSP1439-20131203/67557_1 /TAXON_ID=66791 /ORGANISM="Gonyaulax spinifera, Strain CCMP409" /LENGTH=47 /DNA_ID= /DNA_START= /DNA_END= /DNA_ORIENTATION=
MDVAALGVIHDNDEAPVLDVALPVRDDVWMLQRGQHLHLVDGILALL